jgi:DNA relaxase NicK
MADDDGPSLTRRVTRMECGLDWMTATLPAEATVSGPTYAAAMTYLEMQHKAGNTAKEAVILGYKGVICGKCFVGEREDGLLLRSTSGGTTGFYEHCYHPVMHVSRLDLQVTVWMTNLVGHIGRIAREHAAKHRKLHPKEAKRKISSVDSEDGGYTLYIGSKSSEHFCRLYDKGAESKEEYYAGAWRYEIELHNDAATDAARYILENGLSLEKVVASTVRQYYTARGVYVPWSVTNEANALRPKASLETDDSRSLMWLAAQVRPTVARLAARGYTASVLEALGIDSLPGLETSEDG